MFTMWRAFDAIILTCYIIELILATIMIVFNSLAICCCCRECCLCYQHREEQIPQVPYYHSPQDVERFQASSPNQPFLPTQMNMQQPPYQQQPEQHLMNLSQPPLSAPTAL